MIDTLWEAHMTDHSTPILATMMITKSNDGLFLGISHPKMYLTSSLSIPYYVLHSSKAFHKRCVIYTLSRDHWLCSRAIDPHINSI